VYASSMRRSSLRSAPIRAAHGTVARSQLPGLQRVNGSMRPLASYLGRVNVRAERCLREAAFGGPRGRFYRELQHGLSYDKVEDGTYE